MKSLLTLMILVAAIVAAPVMAEDGNVSDSTLASLGLGSMELLSDADGLAVRGMASTAEATSMSYSSFLVFDPNSGGSFTGQAADFATSNANNAGVSIASVVAASSAAGHSAFTASIANGADTFTASFSVFGASGMSAGNSQ